MLPFELTKDTPYLALSGELWSVFYEYFTEIDRVIKGFYCTLKMTFGTFVSDVVHGHFLWNHSHVDNIKINTG